MYDKNKKILALLLLLSIIFSFFTVLIVSANDESISAKAAALYEPESKRFIYQKNSKMRLGMASTTKIMTALVAIESLDLNESFEVDSRAVGIEGSSIYLEAGEIMNTLDLIYALILESANDAAAALAYKISGSIEEFAELMNKKANELDLSDTHFSNPHGLDSKDHFTSANDLAILTAEALNNGIFAEISASKRRTVESNIKTRTFINHNKMLTLYDGCIGVKTGYTKKSGRSLVSAAVRDGLTLISVTIDAPDDWRDHIKLLNLGFSKLESRMLAYIGQFSYELPIINSNMKIKISNKDEFKIVADKDDAPITAKVNLNRFYCAPIKEGDILGDVVFEQNDVSVGKIPLYALNTVNNN